MDCAICVEWEGLVVMDIVSMPTDYHDELLGRLRRIEAELRSRVECETRCYVDTGPLVERTMAVQAGMGWIGKNTCVINQGMGSWLLLGVIVTSLPVAGGVPVRMLRIGVGVVRGVSMLVRRERWWVRGRWMLLGVLLI